MAHYNDMYDPLLDALNEQEQEFRTKAFSFMYQFLDEMDGDGFTTVKTTKARRKLAENFLKDTTMMDAFTHGIYDMWMVDNHPDEWGEPINWWAEGTSFAGVEDVFPRHFTELISSLLPELRIEMRKRAEEVYHNLSELRPNLIAELKSLAKIANVGRKAVNTLRGG